MAGREPAGIVPAEEVPALVREIRTGLEALALPGGARIPAQVLQSAEPYSSLEGVPPDLLLYVDDLAYRVLGKVGHKDIFVAENDTGPDGANHARAGVLILADGRGARSAPNDLSLYDVAPTVLDRFGLTPPGHMRGRVLR